uniref:Uncharacterized protein n=1 Tax=Parascaris univalens TaxID=6257 RepID=A0A915AAP0_PARUN
MPNAEPSECLYVCDKCASVIRQAIFVCCSKWSERDLYICVECFKEFHYDDEMASVDETAEMKVVFQRQRLGKLLADIERICEKRKSRNARRRYDAILQCKERFRELLDAARHVVLLNAAISLFSTSDFHRILHPRGVSSREKATSSCESVTRNVGLSNVMRKELMLALTTAYLNAKAVVDITLLVFSSLAAQLLPQNLGGNVQWTARSTLDSDMISNATTAIVNTGGESSSTEYLHDDYTGSAVKANEDGYGLSRFQWVHRVSIPKLKECACASKGRYSFSQHWPMTVEFGGGHRSKRTSVEKGHRESGNTSSNNSSYSSSKMRTKTSSNSNIDSFSQPSTSAVSWKGEQSTFQSSISKDAIKNERMKEHKKSISDKKKRERMIQEREEKRKSILEKELTKSSSLSQSASSKFVRLSEIPSSSKIPKIKAVKSASSIPQLFAPEFLVTEKNGAKIVTKLDPTQVAMFLQRSTSVGAMRNAKDEQKKALMKKEISSKVSHDDRKARSSSKKTTVSSLCSVEKKLKKKDDGPKKFHSSSPSMVKRKSNLTSLSPPPVSKSSKSAAKEKLKKCEELGGGSHTKSSKSDIQKKFLSSEKIDSHEKMMPSVARPKIVPPHAPKKPCLPLIVKTQSVISKKDQFSLKSETAQTYQRKEVDTAIPRKDSSDRLTMPSKKPSSAPWKGTREISSNERTKTSEQKAELPEKRTNSNDKKLFKREKSSSKRDPRGKSPGDRSKDKDKLTVGNAYATERCSDFAKSSSPGNDRSKNGAQNEVREHVDKSPGRLGYVLREASDEVNPALLNDTSMETDESIISKKGDANPVEDTISEGARTTPKEKLDATLAAEGLETTEQTVSEPASPIAAPSETVPKQTADVSEDGAKNQSRSGKKSFSEELRRLDAQFSSPSDSEDEVDSGNAFVKFTPQKASSEPRDQPSTSLLPLSDFSFQSLDTSIDHSLLADICSSFENAANIATPPMLCSEYDEVAGGERTATTAGGRELTQRMSASVPPASSAEVDVETTSRSLAASPKFSPVTPSSASTVDVEETSAGCSVEHIARPETPPSVEMVLKAVNSSCTIDEDELKRIIDGFETDYNPILANISVNDVNEAIRQCLEPDQDLEHMLQYDDLSDAVQSGLINPETYVTNLSPEEYCASFEPSSSCPSTETEFSSDSSEMNKSFGPSSCETTSTGDLTPTTSAPSFGVSPSQSPGSAQTRLQNSVRFSMEHDHTYLTSAPTRKHEEPCSTPKKKETSSHLPSHPNSPFHPTLATSAHASTSLQTRLNHLSEYEAALLKIDEIVEECEREVNRSMQSNQLSEYEAAIRKLEEVVRECEKEEKKEEMRKMKEAEQANIRKHEEEARRKITEERSKAAERLQEQRKISAEAARRINEFCLEDVLRYSLSSELAHYMHEKKNELVKQSIHDVIGNCIDETIASTLGSEVERFITCEAAVIVIEHYVADAVSVVLGEELDHYQKQQTMAIEAAFTAFKDIAEDIISSSLTSETVQHIEQLMLKGASSAIADECGEEILRWALENECWRLEKEEKLRIECTTKVTAECIDDVLSSVVHSEVRRRELEEALTGKAAAKITQYCSSSALDSLLASAIQRHNKQEELKRRAVSVVSDSCTSEAVSSALSHEVRRCQELALKQEAATTVTEFCTTSVISSAFNIEVERCHMIEELKNMAAAVVTESCTDSVITCVLSSEVQRHHRQEAMKQKAITAVTELCTGSIISNVLSEEVERHRQIEAMKQNALNEVSEECANELLTSSVRYEAALCERMQQSARTATADLTIWCIQETISDLFSSEVSYTMQLYAEQLKLKALEQVKNLCARDIIFAVVGREILLLMKDLREILQQRSAREAVKGTITELIQSTFAKGVEAAFHERNRKLVVAARSQFIQDYTAEVFQSIWNDAVSKHLNEMSKQTQMKATEKITEICVGTVFRSAMKKQIEKAERRAACHFTIKQLVDRVVQEEAEETERRQTADSILHTLEDRISYIETCEEAGTLMKKVKERNLAKKSMELLTEMLSDVEDVEVQEVAEKVFEEEAAISLSSSHDSGVNDLKMLRSSSNGKWKPLGLWERKRMAQIEAAVTELKESLIECNGWISEVDKYLRKFEGFYKTDCALLYDVEAERKNYLFMEFMSNSTVVSDTERLLAEAKSRIEALLTHREVCLNEVKDRIRIIDHEINAASELHRSMAKETSRLTRIARSKQNQLQVQGNKERRARELAMTEFCSDVDSTIRLVEKQLVLRKKSEEAVRLMITTRREQALQSSTSKTAADAEAVLANAVMRHSMEQKVTSEFVDSLNSFVKEIERRKEVRYVIGYLLDCIHHAEEQEVERTSAVLHTVSNLVSTVSYNRLCEEASALLQKIYGSELEAISERCSSELLDSVLSIQMETIAKEEMNKAVIDIVVNSDYNSRMEVCVPKVSDSNKETWKLFGLSQSLKEGNLDRAEKDLREIREDYLSWDAEVDMFLRLFEKFSQADFEILREADRKRKTIVSANEKLRQVPSHLQEVEGFLASFRKKIEPLTQQEGSTVDTVLEHISAVENEIKTVKHYESALAEEIKMLPTCERLEQKQQKRQIEDDRRVRRASIERCEESLAGLLGRVEKCLVSLRKKERRMLDIVEPEATRCGIYAPSLRPRSGVTRTESTVDHTSNSKKVEAFIVELQAFIECVERTRGVRCLMDDLLARTSYEVICEDAQRMLAICHERDISRLTSQLLEGIVDETEEEHVEKIAEAVVRTAVEEALANSQSGSVENGQEERGSFLYLLESLKNFGWNNAEVICKEVTRELSTWVWEVDAYFARFEQLAEADRKVLHKADVESKKRLTKIQNFENPSLVKKAEAFLKTMRTRIERRWPSVDVPLEVLKKEYTSIQEQFRSVSERKNVVEAELSAELELTKRRQWELDEQMVVERQNRSITLAKIRSDIHDAITFVKHDLDGIENKVSAVAALINSSQNVSPLPLSALSSLEADVALALSVVIDAVECKEMNDFIDELAMFVDEVNEMRLRRPRSALEHAVQDVVDSICLAVEASFWQIEPNLRSRMTRRGPPFHYEKFTQLLEAGLLSPEPPPDLLSAEEELADVTLRLRRTPFHISAYCTPISSQLDFFDEPPENFLEFEDEPLERMEQSLTTEAKAPVLFEFPADFGSKKPLSRTTSLSLISQNEQCCRIERPSSAPARFLVGDISRTDRLSCSPPTCQSAETSRIVRPIPIAASVISDLSKAPLLMSSPQFPIGQGSAFTPFQREVNLTMSGVENSYVEPVLDPNLISLLLTQISPSLQKTSTVVNIDEPPPADPRPVKRSVAFEYSESETAAAEQRHSSSDMLQKLHEKRRSYEQMFYESSACQKNPRTSEESFPQKRKRVSFQDEPKENTEDGDVEYIGTVLKTNLSMQMYPGLRRIRKIDLGAENKNFCSHGPASFEIPGIFHDEQSEESSPEKNRIVDGKDDMRSKLPPIYSALSDQSIRFAFELLYGGYTKFSEETAENMSRKGLIYQRLWRAALVTKPLATWIMNNEHITKSQRDEIVNCCRQGTKLFLAHCKFAGYMTANVHIIRPVLQLTEVPFCFDRLPTVFARVFDRIFDEIRMDVLNGQRGSNRQTHLSSVGQPQRNSLPSFCKAFKNSAPIYCSSANTYEQSAHVSTFEENSTLQSNEQLAATFSGGPNTVGTALFTTASGLDRIPQRTENVRSSNVAATTTVATDVQQLQKMSAPAVRASQGVMNNDVAVVKSRRKPTSDAKVTTKTESNVSSSRSPRRPRSTSRRRKPQVVEDDIQPSTSTQDSATDTNTRPSKKGSKRPSIAKPMQKAKQFITGMLNIESEVESDEEHSSKANSSSGTADKKKKGRQTKTKRQLVDADEPSCLQQAKPQKRQSSTTRGRRRRHKSTSSEGSKISETKPTQKKRSRTVESRMRTPEPELTKEQLMVRTVEKAIADEYGRQAVPFTVLMTIMEEVIAASKKGDDLSLFNLNDAISNVSNTSNESWVTRLLHKDHKKKIQIDECAMIELLDMLVKRAVRIAISDREKQFCRENNIEELEFNIYKFNLWLENENVRRKNKKHKHVTLIDEPSMQAVTAVLREVNFLTHL